MLGYWNLKAANQYNEGGFYESQKCMPQMYSRLTYGEEKNMYF